MQLLELGMDGQREPSGLPVDWPVRRYKKASKVIYKQAVVKATDNFFWKCLDKADKG